MKKEHILGILFFAGLWGISEAVLGGVLYRAAVPYASVPLTIIGFIVMSTGIFPAEKHGNTYRRLRDVVQVSECPVFCLSSPWYSSDGHLLRFVF